MSRSNPIFQSIFGQGWDVLPDVMRQHYSNRPYSNDVVTVKGMMTVKMSWLAKLGAPLLKMSGTLVPKEGVEISATVHFRSELDSNFFCFDREFHFADGAVHRFYSRMEPIGGNEVVEWTATGIGWHAAYSHDNGTVKLTHVGYCVKLFGKRISLPLNLLLGRANAVELPTSENDFTLDMHIRHWLFGELYSYGGRFTITEVNNVRSGA